MQRSNPQGSNLLGVKKKKLPLLCYRSANFWSLLQNWRITRLFILYQQTPQSLGISFRLTGVFLFHLSLHSSFALPHFNLLRINCRRAFWSSLKKTSTKEKFPLGNALIYCPDLWILCFLFLFLSLSLVLRSCRACFNICACLGYWSAVYYFFDPSRARQNWRVRTHWTSLLWITKLCLFFCF